MEHRNQIPIVAWGISSLMVITLLLTGCSGHDKHIEDKHLIGMWKSRVVGEKDGAPTAGGYVYYIYNKPSKNGVGSRDTVTLQSGKYSVFPRFFYRITKSYDNGRSIVFQRFTKPNSDEIEATVEFSVLGEHGYEALVKETNPLGEYSRSWQKVIDENELQRVREAISNQNK